MISKSIEKVQEKLKKAAEEIKIAKKPRKPKTEAKKSEEISQSPESTEAIRANVTNLIPDPVSEFPTDPAGIDTESVDKTEEE